MPRLRNTEDNESLKRYCLAHFYYDMDKGYLHYNKNTPYSIPNRSKKYIDKPLPLRSQVMYTAAGGTYEYITHDITIGTKKLKILRSRLIWLLVHGEWPTGNIIHKDGNTRNCDHRNLIEVSPRVMHVYTRYVRNLDKNILSSHIAKVKEKKTSHTNEIYITELSFEDGRLCVAKKRKSIKNMDHYEAVNYLYDSYMNYITHVIDSKLMGVNLRPYHINDSRHKKIMKTYRKQFGDSE